MKRIALAYAVAGLLSCSPTYQSGSTECSTAGTCPSGFICGGTNTVGAASVCYDISGTSCSTSDAYYCPQSSTCWSTKVACDTVINCGNTLAACDTEGQQANCSGSGKCTIPGGSTGGSGGNGGTGLGGAGGSTGTGVGPCSPVSTDTACDTCMEQACCSQLTACANQTSCENLASCINNCASGNTTCMNSCDSSYSSGLSTLTSLFTCVEDSCSASCN
jgi:hypothetical protein